MVRIPVLGTPFGDVIDMAAVDTFSDPLGLVESAYHMVGGVGNDRLSGDSQSDLLEGGSGNDTLFGNGGDDVLDGGDGNDSLNGGGGHDFLFGGDGRDTLNGGSGNDALSGGSGNDILVGGAGRDTLAGGTGEDIFRWMNRSESPNGTGRDEVTDFVRGTDMFDLSWIDANTLVTGNQAFAFVGAAGFSGTAGQLRGEILTRGDGSTVTLLQADVNGDRAADFELLLNGSHTLATSDFIL